MSKVSLVAKIVAAEGREEALAERLTRAVDSVAGEAGTEVYVLNRDPAEPGVLWMFELYTDQEALGAHGSSESMQALVKDMGELARATELHVLTPVAAKGLAL